MDRTDVYVGLGGGGGVRFTPCRLPDSELAIQKSDFIFSLLCLRNSYFFRRSAFHYVLGSDFERKRCPLAIAKYVTDHISLQITGDETS